MPTSIIDACAMLAYLQGEPGADVVEEILTRPNETCLAARRQPVRGLLQGLRKIE